MNRRGAEGGFTVTEMLVSVLITSIVILAASMLFDFNRRVATSEIQVADLQQSLRAGLREVTKTVRVAGRGGMPASIDEGNGSGNDVFRAASGAVEILNNVTDANRTLVAGGVKALRGSDVLIVRGVLEGAVVRAEPPTYNNSDLSLATGGTIVINRNTAVVVDQDLADLTDAVTDGSADPAIIMQSTPSEPYIVAEIFSGGSSATSDQVSVRFGLSGGTHSADYRALWTDDANEDALALADGAYVGVLRERRFFVYNASGNDSDESSPTAIEPVLGYLDFYPGTSTAVNNNPTPIANGIYDLQVALGFDSTNDPTGAQPIPMTVWESDDGLNDDWLFNAAGETDAAAPWRGASLDVVAPLRYIRISVVGIADRPDPYYEGDPVTALEDRAYGTDAVLNSPTALSYQRRLLTSQISVRNL
ncbi:MAG: hypothetical protein AAGD01_00790 [Acidobacteriota bacterium]